MRKMIKRALVALMVAMSMVLLVAVNASGTPAIYTKVIPTYDDTASPPIHSVSRDFRPAAHVYTNWSHFAGDSPFGPHAWLRPTEAFVRMNVATSIGARCSFLDPYEGTSYKFYFVNMKTGAHFTSSWHFLSCSPTNTGGRWIDFSKDMPRFHGNIKWRCHVWVHLGPFIPDQFGWLGHSVNIPKP